MLSTKIILGFFQCKGLSRVSERQTTLPVHFPFSARPLYCGVAGFWERRVAILAA